MLIMGREIATAKMNQANEGKDVDIVAIVPVKRKRGRPRKYPSLLGENDRSPLYYNLKHGENARAPPGFRRVNGDQSHPVEPSVDANDVMVGQVVTGVVEAAFDAGYLLSVRIGNSKTSLRGVVFNPGRCVPISAENDVAPGVQMIIRNEIPLPNDIYTQARRYERNITPHGNVTMHLSHERSTTSWIPDKGKPACIVGPQATIPLIARGNTSPAVLSQPINVSDVVPHANQPSPVACQSAHLASSMGYKHVQAANLSNYATSTLVQFIPQSSQTETNIFNAATVQHEEGMPTEVFVRVQGQDPSQSAQILTENCHPAADRIQDGNSGGFVQDEVGTPTQALFIEQAVLPYHDNQSA